MRSAKSELRHLPQKRKRRRRREGRGGRRRRRRGRGRKPGLAREGWTEEGRWVQADGGRSRGVRRSIGGQRAGSKGEMGGEEGVRQEAAEGEDRAGGGAAECG